MRIFLPTFVHFSHPIFFKIKNNPHILIEPWMKMAQSFGLFGRLSSFFCKEILPCFTYKDWASSITQYDKMWEFLKFVFFIYRKNIKMSGSSKNKSAKINMSMIKRSACLYTCRKKLLLKIFLNDEKSLFWS